MTLDELLRSARAGIPRDPSDAAALLRWRDDLHALRHVAPDGTRAAEVADAVLALAASSVLLLRGDPEPLLALQDHVWRFSRLKGNSTDEASAAAEEIRRRLSSLDADRRRHFIADLYRLLMAAELDLLAVAQPD